MNSTHDSSCELRRERHFKAPLELVLKMWSDPAHLNHWFGPKGFRITTHQMSFEIGGEWIYTMHGPDGADYPNYVRYREAGPETISYVHGTSAEDIWFEVFVKLTEPTPGLTVLEFRSVFPTPEALRRAVEEVGADRGLNETLGRLEVAVTQQLAIEDPFHFYLSKQFEVDVVGFRSFRASKELVFEAFTNGELLKRWWGPYGLVVAECDSDAQIGGSWSTVNRSADGTEFRFKGEYLAIETNASVSRTFEIVGAPDMNMTQTATFVEVGGLTRLTLLTEFSSPEARESLLERGMARGLSEAFNRLEVLLFEANSNGEYPKLRIVREFDAPRELVWRAWSEADRFAKWWGPKDCPVAFSKFDFVPGGICHYSMVWPNGMVAWGLFVYREIAAPFRLAFVNSFSDETATIQRAPFSNHWPKEILNVVTFEDLGGRTRLVLDGAPLSASLDELKQFEGFFDSMKQGFGGTLDQLESFLKSDV